MAKYFSIILFLLLVLGIVPVCCEPAPGDLLASFSLKPITGSVRTWQPGKVTILSFCAFWCDTWKEQNQRLIRMHTALGALPVDFITISVDARWSERSIGKIPGSVLLDPGGTLQKKLKIHAVPYTLVVDAAGRVRYASRGIVNQTELKQAVLDSVKGKPAQKDSIIYLAFDDFPSRPGRTAPTTDVELDHRLLDILRACDVKATLFCIGQNIARNKPVLRRAAQEDHSLQIHSWYHQPGNPQLDRCTREIRYIGKTQPTIYHPPGTSQFLYLDGTKIPITVINPYDYHRPGQQELSRRILLAAKPGSVILLHAGVRETLDALPHIIQSLQARGYTFRTIH